MLTSHDIDALKRTVQWTDPANTPRLETTNDIQIAHCIVEWKPEQGDAKPPAATLRDKLKELQ